MNLANGLTLARIFAVPLIVTVLLTRPKGGDMLLAAIIFLLASATDQEQQEMLASTLKRAANAKEYLQKMRDAYLAGDSDTLLSLIHDQESGPASLMKKMVDDRNITMTASLEQYLKGKEPCFVVVGAAHLLGDNGIIKLLQSKGYRVELVGTVPR